MVTFTESV